MIYLDNASTTPLREEVKNEMEAWLTTEFGNPSSHHALGRRAAEAVWNARRTIASMICAEPDEIFFTSGGSEANTWAIDGLYNVNNGGHIIMSNIEHHSLLNTKVKHRFVGVNQKGIIDLSAFRKSIESNTPIVCCMMVNNEIGTIEPIFELDNICFKENCFLHVDAVQAFGHIPIDVNDFLCMSTMSASAHKIGGPKGIGFLYIQKDVQQLYRELIHGGQQEFGKRGGTENVAAIVGFAKACELAQDEMQSVYDKNRALSLELFHYLSWRLNIKLNGEAIDSENRMPNNINICIEGVRAEQLIELLSKHGVYVSSGSACNSDSDEPSHVLTAIGRSEDEANSSIRITLGSQTTKEEIEEAGEIIVKDAMLLGAKGGKG